MVFLGWETSWKVTNKSLHVNNNFLTITGGWWDYLVDLHIRWIIKMFDLGISHQAAFILSRTGKMKAMSPFTCKSFSRIPSDFEQWKEVLQAKNLTVYPLNKRTLIRSNVLWPEWGKWSYYTIGLQLWWSQHLLSKFLPSPPLCCHNWCLKETRLNH